MIIRGGDHKHTATDGTTIKIDRPLSQSQVDVIVQMLHDAGAQPNTVIAVKFEGEQPPTIHYRPDIGYRLNQRFSSTRPDRSSTP